MEPSPLQYMKRDFRSKIKFTPLSESLYDILRKLRNHHIITFLDIRSKNSKNKECRWYKENKIFHYYHQKDHDTNKCIILKNVVQDLIDNGKLEVDNRIAIPS